MNSIDKSKLKTGEIELPNGETLFIKVSGKGSDILFLVPGIWIDHRCFDPLIPYLEQTFTLIAPDLRGTGKSTYNNPINDTLDVVSDLDSIIDYLQLKSVNLLGFSFGCSICLLYASVHPSKVNKIVLMAPQGLEGLPTWDEKKVPNKTKEELNNSSIIKLTINAIMTNDSEAIVDRLCTHVNLPLTPEIMKLYHSQAQQVLDCKDVVDMRWAAYTCNLTDKKKWITEGSGAILKVKSKTLLLYSEDDNLIPQEVFKQFSEYLGDNLTTFVFQKGSHILHYTNSEKIAEETINFIFPSDC